MRLVRAVLLMSASLALAALFGAGSSAAVRSGSGGTVRYVSATDALCGGRTPCYSTIQQAVDEAEPGDEIDVSEGTYSGVQTVHVAGVDYAQVVLIDKPLRLLGGYSSTDWDVRDPQAYPSIIDADRSGRGITVLGESGSEVEIAGFTVVHGDYSGLGNPPDIANQACARTGGDCGGGIYARSVRLSLSDSFVVDNVASRNETYSDGGGLYAWNLAPGSVISNTLFYSNTTGAGSGGGGGACLYLGSDVRIVSCTFSQNLAGGPGGALYVFQPDGLVAIVGTSLLGNESTRDGGGAVWASLVAMGDALDIDRTIFGYNMAASQGAAILLDKVGTDPSRVRMVNTLMIYNSARSAFSSVLDLENDTDATGGALELHASHVTVAVVGTDAFLRLSATQGAIARALLTNTLVVEGQAAFVGEQADGSVVEIHHTHTLTWLMPNLHLTQAGTPTFEATGAVSGDPMLDYEGRPQSGSAAIDAGVDAGVMEDLDGARRPVGPPDIGAYEFAERLLLPIAIRGEPSFPER